MVKNRIKEFRTVAASSLVRNPQNWRTHPPFQTRVMREILDRIGNVDVLKAVETGDGLMLIDGHLRADVLEADEVLVAVLDLDEPEQAEVLATFDPLSALAGMAEEAYTALAAQIVNPTPDMERLAEAMANGNFVQLQPLPRFSADEQEFPDLPDGDKSPIGQMTFTVSETQRAVIDRALKAAKPDASEDDVNQNSNGNALAYIAERFLEGGE